MSESRARERMIVQLVQENALLATFCAALFSKLAGQLNVPESEHVVTLTADDMSRSDPRARLQAQSISGGAIELRLLSKPPEKSLVIAPS